MAPVSTHQDFSRRPGKQEGGSIAPLPRADPGTQLGKKEVRNKQGCGIGVRLWWELGGVLSLHRDPFPGMLFRANDTKVENK